MKQSPILNRQAKNAHKNLPGNVQLFLSTTRFMTPQEIETYKQIVERSVSKNAR